MKTKKHFGKRRRAQAADTRVRDEALREKIEVLKDSDTRDADLLPYVDGFLSNLKKIGPMEEISLLTQQDAKQALEMIDKTLKELSAHLGVARSLKQLLQAKRSEK